MSVGQERQEQVQELAVDMKVALKDACKDVPRRGAGTRVFGGPFA